MTAFILAELSGLTKTMPSTKLHYLLRVTSQKTFAEPCLIQWQEAMIAHKHCHFSYCYLTPLLFLPYLSLLFFFLFHLPDFQSVSFPQCPSLFLPHYCSWPVILCLFSSSSQAFALPSLLISSHLSLVSCFSCAPPRNLARVTVQSSFLLLQHNLVLISFFRFQSAEQGS